MGIWSRLQDSDVGVYLPTAFCACSSARPGSGTNGDKAGLLSRRSVSARARRAGRGRRATGADSELREDGLEKGPGPGQSPTPNLGVKPAQFPCCSRIPH